MESFFVNGELPERDKGLPNVTLRFSVSTTDLPALSEPTTDLPALWEGLRVHIVVEYDARLHFSHCHCNPNLYNSFAFWSAFKYCERNLYQCRHPKAGKILLKGKETVSRSSTKHPDIMVSHPGVQKVHFEVTDMIMFRPRCLFGSRD